MGQNAAGGVRLVVPPGCPPGLRILMYFGEVLYNVNGSAPRARVEGPPSQGISGTVDQSNLLGAKARVEYICSGSNVSELYEPSFTYFGYQYVELVGYPGVPSLDTVQQRIMHSDVESKPSDTRLPRTPCVVVVARAWTCGTVYSGAWSPCTPSVPAAATRCAPGACSTRSR